MTREEAKKLVLQLIVAAEWQTTTTGRKWAAYHEQVCSLQERIITALCADVPQTTANWCPGCGRIFTDADTQEHPEDFWCCPNCGVWGHQGCGGPMQNDSPIPIMLEALQDARSALQSLPAEALGVVPSTPDRYGWPIRDELIAKVGAAIKIAEEPPAICGGKRIPIDERLPECDQTVVVWVRGYNLPRVMRFYYDDELEWFAGAHNDTLSREDVTHWMPLPEGPKEETPPPPTHNQGAPL